jgi:Protein of unknown function (DUF3147)
MDILFWLKLLLGFIIGSLWVTLTTFSAERYGSKVGGLIGGLPSTVVVALFFIGFTQSPQAAADATTVMPLAQGLNGLVVLAFMLLIPYGLWTGLLSSLLLWLFQSTLLYLLDIQAFWISILGWLILLVFCSLTAEKWMKIVSQDRLIIKYQPYQLLWRAIIGGSIIAFAIFMGKVGGPLLGGIFSSFPAMFLSTLVITYKTADSDFSRSVGKSLLISGLINVPLYEIMVRMLYPSIGLVLGTILALLFSLISGYLTLLFMKARIS